MIRATAVCAYCKKMYRECNLKRCGGCSLRYYCSRDCSKADWKTHKVECKQAEAHQTAIKEGVSSDPSQRLPFDVFIADFEAEPFTAVSYVNFISYIRPLYFGDATTIREDLNDVSFAGYLRLLALTVRALNEFPLDTRATECGFVVLRSYCAKFCSPLAGMEPIKDLFRAKLLPPFVDCLRKHIGQISKALNFWIIVDVLNKVERAKYNEILGSMGLAELLILTVNTHKWDEDICFQAFRGYSNWLNIAHRTQAKLPPNNYEAILSPAVASMLRFPNAYRIIDICLGTLYYIFMVTDAEQQSRFCASMAAIGCYEIFVDTLRKFPEEMTTAMYCSLMIGKIAQQYFANKSRPRNAEGCIALGGCLHHFASDTMRVHQIIADMSKIVRESEESAMRFAYEGRGFVVLKPILVMHRMDGASFSRFTEIITFLTSSATNRACWDRESAEYAQLQLDVEEEILPVLVYATRLYMHSPYVEVINNVALALICAATLPWKPYPEITQLVQEVMRLHPSKHHLHSVGASYLSIFFALAEPGVVKKLVV